MKTKPEKKEICAEELKRAVKKFTKEGGIIERLPDEKSASHRQVGGKYVITELGGEII